MIYDYENVEQSNVDFSSSSDNAAFGSFIFSKNWKDLTYKYKYENFLSKTMAKIDDLLQLEYDDNAINAWNEIRQHKCLNKDKIINQIEVFKNECEPLLNALDLTNKISVRIQILSLVPNHFTKEVIMNAMPDVTKYQIDEARKLNPAETKVKDRIFRLRITQSSIDIFLNFITSENYLQDVAYGVNKIKLESFSNVVVPNVVRLANKTTIVFDYHEMCKKEAIKPLCKTTCLKILNSCPSSYRKCLQGLDNVMAEGLASYSKLEELIGKLLCLESKKKELIDKLTCTRNYIKFKFKNNLALKSSCADHCCNLALSENGSKFNQKCDHDHSRSCYDCILIETTITEIEKEIYKSNFNDETTLEFMDQINAYKTIILEWKHHIIRTFCQDLIKYEILNNLSDKDIYIHMDWAMKFIPISYRESQEQFFGKRGISWHVTCIVFSDEEKKKTSTFIHLFDNTSQDAFSVLNIIDSIMNNIKNRFGSRNLFIKSDNAGCYHSQMIIGCISYLSRKHNHNLKRYDFSEAQAGKDICDRKISPIKRAIQDYVCNGNDVLNAKQMKAAIESNPRLKSISVEICEIKDDLNDKSIFDIKGITKYNSFEFDSESVNFSRNYKIGFGEKQKLDSFINKKYFHKLEDFINNISMIIVAKSNHEIQFGSVIQNASINEIFTCNNSGCSLMFNNKNDLEDHCCIISKKISSLDKIKLQYIRIIEDIRYKNIEKSNEFISEVSKIINDTCNRNLNLGYAIKYRANNRFSEKQKEFLLEMFNIGEKDSSKKMSPSVVRLEMSKKFKFSDTLKDTQIKSFFANLIKKNKNSNCIKKKTNSKKNKQENDDEISTDDGSDYYGDEDAYNKLIQDIQNEIIE